MKSNQQLIQINRNFVICFLVSASLSAVVAQTLGGLENYINTTLTIAFGYVVYFGIFSALFYIDNRKRYRTMKSELIKKELLFLVSSFGIGEIVYLAIRWPSLFYFLEIEMEPFLASLTSEVIATALYMLTVTVFLRKTKTF